MTTTMSDRVWEILACPYCGNPLARVGNEFSCSRCSERYPVMNGAQVDLRLRRTKAYPFSFPLETDLSHELGYDYRILQRNPSPEVDFTAFKAPWHFTTELLSH